jgi:hypothetical protein
MGEQADHRNRKTIRPKYPHEILQSHRFMPRLRHLGEGTLTGLVHSFLQA